MESTKARNAAGLRNAHPGSPVWPSRLPWARAVLFGAYVALAAAPALALDLNAQWLDSSGYRVDVVQDGDSVVALTTEGPHSGPWKRAEGRLRNRTLRLDVDGTNFEGRIAEGFDRIRWANGTLWVRIPQPPNPGDLVRRLREAVVADRTLEVASLMHFPLPLQTGSGAGQIEDVDALRTRYPELFDAEVRGDLEARDPYLVARDWPDDSYRGSVDFGRLRLAIEGRCLKGSCPPSEPDCARCGRRAYRIAAIEVRPAGPDTVAGLFDELQHRLRAGQGATAASLVQYPIDVTIDGKNYPLAEPEHFEGFRSPIFERTRDDLLELSASAIDPEGRVRVPNGLFTLALACTGITTLECAPGDTACERQRHEEECRKRDPRITGIEIFSERRYTRRVADLRGDLLASGALKASGRAALVPDELATGRWLFLASSEEQPPGLVDGVRVAQLSYGDAPAGPHRAGSLRDAAQPAALEFPALSPHALLERAKGPEAARREVAVHPGPLELPGAAGSTVQTRPYLVVRWVSGSRLRFARVTAVLRRADQGGDGITVTATAPDGRLAQALMNRRGERVLQFELDAIEAGQWVDLSVGPRGSADDDSLLVALTVEAIETGSPDPAALRRSVAAVLGSAAIPAAK